jgi:hypothetical protein
MAYDAKAIDAAIQALIGTGGPATSKFQYKPGTISYKPTSYKNINVAAHLTPDMFNYKPKESKKKSSGDPWWKEALYGMNGVGGSVTNQVANWTDGKGLDMRDLTPSALLKSQLKSWGDGKLGWDDLAGSGVVKALKKGNKNDIPGYETAANIAKGQAKAWTDGEFGFKDIPGFGGLVYAGKKNKGTEQILENAGWKDKKGLGLHDIASFAGDVLLDPTTYLTFGGASALKAGNQAAKNAAKKIGLDEGIEGILKGFKGSADDLAKHVSSKVYDNALTKYGSSASKVVKGSKSSVSEARNLASAKADKAFQSIINDLKAARNKSQNNLFNFDVPFTNITAGTGKLPKMLQKVDAPIGKTGAGTVTKLLEKYGVNGSKQTDLLKKHFNVAKPEELTSQALKHLQDTLKNIPMTSGNKNVDISQLFDPKKLGNYAPIKGPLPSKTNIQQFLADNSKTLFGKKVEIKDIKGLKVPLSSKNLDGITKLLNNPPAKMTGGKLTAKDLSNLAEQINSSRTVLKNFGKGKVNGAEIKWKGATSQARNVDTALTKKKFVQDMGGKSKVGQYLADKLFSAINARSLGSADPFINSQANHIADADTFIRGNRGLMQSQISKIEKAAKGLSEEDMKMIPYMIEKKYPGKMSAQEFLAQASNLPQLQKVAGQIEKVLGDVKKRGLESGTLTAPIKNYFPHMVTKLNNDPEAVTKLLSDPNIQKLLNSSVDKSNQSRKSFDSFASWKDAVSALEDAKKGLTNPEDIANIDEKIGQLSQLFEENPIKAVQQRYQSSIRSMAMKDMYDNFRSNGVLKPRDAATPAEKTSGAYHPLSKSEAAKLGMKEGDLMHKEVFDGLKKVDSIFTDQGINKVVESMNAVTGIWKSLVTTFVPTHHLYNLVGNVANNAMVGVTPAMYTKAGKLIAKAKAGKLTAAEEKVMQKAYDYGVLGGGYKADRFDPMRQARLQNSKLARIEDKVANSRFSNVMNGVGNIGDDLTRMALFLHGTKRSGTMKGGGEMVRKYLYNYGEQTQADKALKIAMPFWNWTKNNLPRQLMEFMQQPRYAATYSKFQDMLSEDRPQGPGYTNDYLQYGDKKFWNMRLPLQDLSNAGKPLDTFLNSMNPMAKMPIEYKMNKQFFNDQPIDWEKRDQETPYRGEALAKYFSNQAGMVGKGYDAVTNDKSWLEDLRNIFIGKPIEVK